MPYLSESVVEHAALDWFRKLGYNVISGPDIPPGPQAFRESYSDAIFASVVRGALERLNPNLPAAALEDAFRQLTQPEGMSLEARNRSLHRLMVDGVTVEYPSDNGAIRGGQAKVIDFDDPTANDWLTVNQFTVVENNHERRPDIVLFVNGLPLVVIEIKNPIDEDATDGEELDRKEKLKTKWAQLEAIVGAQKRLVRIAQDIVAHFESCIEVMDGKERLLRAVRELSQAVTPCDRA